MFIVQSMNLNKRQPAEAGFSFLELTLVIALLSLFFLTTLPVVPAVLEQQKTKNFIEELAGDLYIASNEARTRQVEAMIDLFPSQSFYLLRVDGKQVKKVNTPKGMLLDSNYPNHRILFYSDGQVSRGGTIKVKDHRGKVTEIIVQVSSGRFWIKSG